jgi:hypothetical protein
MLQSLLPIRLGIGRSSRPDMERETTFLCRGLPRGEGVIALLPVYFHQGATGVLKRVDFNEKVGGIDKQDTRQNLL